MRTKSLLLLVLLAVSSLIWADDTIYLKNGEEIKAKVSKIAPNTIEYKKTSQTDGPSYELPKSDILMIIYENGEKDIFVNKSSYTNHNSNTKFYGQNHKLGIVEYKDDRLLSLNGKYITEDQYKDFAKKNCRAAYDQFYKGEKLKKAGVICLSVGTPLTAAGIILTSLYAVSDVTTTYIGTICLTLGTPTMIAGIPLYCVGKDLRHKSYGTFNAQYQANNTAQLQLNFNNNGIGLALQF